MKPPIALISSTIAPSITDHYGGVPAGYDPDLRLQQTRAGIQSLLDLGVEEIYVADNSGDNWRKGMEEELRPARVQVFKHHQYRNKGISELYVLLAALPQLPQDRPIIKVSGRYRLHTRLDQHLGTGDMVVREKQGLSLINCATSTIAYAVRDAAVHERFLLETRRDVFGFPSRIVGPRSLLRIVRNSLFPAQDPYPYDDPAGSIEHASWRAIRKCKFQLHHVESLGIEGAGGQYGTAKTE